MNQNDIDDSLAVIADRAGGIDSLLEAFFGFLSRRTDFYVQYDRNKITSKTQTPHMGFPDGVAREKVLSAFSKFPLRDFNPAPLETFQAKQVTIKAPSTSLIEYTAENKMIPIGNGGIGPSYYWTQSLTELTIYYELNFDQLQPTLTKKDIICTLKSNSISLKIKEVVHLEGSLHSLIRVDESVWTWNRELTTADTSVLIINLEKVVPTWWTCVIVGHPEIDTTKVWKLDHFANL